MSSSLIDLPAELISEVLFRLPIYDVAKVARTAVILRDAANSNLLWMKRCLADIGSIEADRKQDESWKQLYIRLCTLSTYFCLFTASNSLEPHIPALCCWHEEVRINCKPTGSVCSQTQFVVAIFQFLFWSPSACLASHLTLVGVVT
jgi:hypothetical protein